tara:strand:+ start:2176 stop:2439 length:264 start_codon:yes stop_codon:yes gene_type:complete
LDDVLDMSFQQITLVARCIVRHKAKMLNMVFEPIAQGLSGVKGNKGKGRPSTTGPRTQQKLKKTGANAQVQDQMLISRLGSLGIDVK